MPQPGSSGRNRDDQASAQKALGVALIAAGSFVLLTSVLVVAGLLVTHLGVHGSVGHWDDHVSSWFARHGRAQWNRWSADATVLANTLGIAVIAAAVTVLLAATKRTKPALLIPLALCIELASFLTVNYTVRRPRPTVRHLGSTPSTYSWPSGHVAATLVLYGGIALLVTVSTRRLAPKVLAWCLVTGLTVAVAMSRIYRGEHHATDTLAGVVLGAGALASAAYALQISKNGARDRADRHPATPGADEWTTVTADGLPRRAAVG